jgi:hypothetical protein
LRLQSSLRVTEAEQEESMGYPATRLRITDLAKRQYAAMARLSGSVELDSPTGSIPELSAGRASG